MTVTPRPGLLERHILTFNACWLQSPQIFNFFRARLLRSVGIPSCNVPKVCQPHRKHAQESSCFSVHMSRTTNKNFSPYETTRAWDRISVPLPLEAPRGEGYGEAWITWTCKFGTKRRFNHPLIRTSVRSSIFGHLFPYKASSALIRTPFFAQWSSRKLEDRLTFHETALRIQVCSRPQGRPRRRVSTDRVRIRRQRLATSPDPRPWGWRALGKPQLRRSGSGA